MQTKYITNKQVIDSLVERYHVLTEKDTLKKILEQGLGEEYMQHKDKITHFFIICKTQSK
jgi:hypothetical protein